MNDRIPPLVAVRFDDLKPDDIVFMQARDHAPVRRPTKNVRITGWSGTTETGVTNSATFQPVWDLHETMEPRGLLELRHHGFNVAWGLGTVLSQCVANLRHGQAPWLPEHELAAPGEAITVEQLATIYGVPSAEGAKGYSWRSAEVLYDMLPVNGRRPAPRVPPRKRGR